MPEQKKSIVKSSYPLTRFDPKARKELVVRGLNALQEDNRQNDYNIILSLVLREAYFRQCCEDGTLDEDEDLTKIGGFTVVDPYTAPVDSEVARIKLDDYDVGDLFDLLVAINKKSVRLSIKSSPQDGYIIDYDGTYKKYFEENGGGWREWYKDHPDAHGYTQISLPAYDKEKGFVLVYIDIQSDDVVGVGSIDAYRYKDGKLGFLGDVLLRIS
jgi:hypothetical protein